MFGLRRHFRSWTARPARFFATALALALLVALAERGFGCWRSRTIEPGRGACWIWAPDFHRARQPVAFYAVRDFEREAAGPTAAALSISADEAYTLFLNGAIVGSNSHRSAIDRYAVGHLLRLGLNRIVVELRSSRGAGGLLASLADPAVEGEIVTDGSWRIYRSHLPGLFENGPLAAAGESPRIWQRSPTGRWRIAAAGGDRPIAAGENEPFHWRWPVKVRRARNGERWHELSWPRLSFPSLGSEILLDWGKEIEGYLHFDPASPEPTPALVWFGAEPPDPESRPPDEVMTFVPGRDWWRSIHPRRFRYALLIGAEPRTVVRVFDLREDQEAALAPPSEAASGVFGLRPGAVNGSIVERVRRRFRS